jgi:hypothetical protein
MSRQKTIKADEAAADGRPAGHRGEGRYLKHEETKELKQEGTQENGGRSRGASPQARPSSLGRQKLSWALIFTYRGWRTEFGRSHVWVVGEKAWL